jgi:hypothetical protein
MVARYRWLGALAAALLLVTPALAEDLLAEIRIRLGDPGVVRGDFEQRKYLESTGKPLLSAGDFLVVKGRGVVWRTRTPVPQTLRLTPTEIRIEQGGQVRLRLSGERDPLIRGISQLVFAFTAADFSRLEESFRVAEGRWEGAIWRVALEPRSVGVGSAVRVLRLEGSTHIRRVEIVTATGERTDIRFRNVVLGGELAPEERDLFE